MNPATPNQDAYQPERRNKKRKIALEILLGVEVIALVAGVLVYFLYFNKQPQTSTYTLKDAAESLTLIKSRTQSNWTWPSRKFEGTEIQLNGGTTTTKNIAYSQSDPFSLVVQTGTVVTSSSSSKSSTTTQTYSETSNGYTLKTNKDGAITDSEVDATGMKNAIAGAYSKFRYLSRADVLQAEIDMLLNLYPVEQAMSNSSVPASSATSSEMTAVSSHPTSSVSPASSASASSVPALSISSLQLTGDKVGNLFISITGVLDQSATPTLAFYVKFENYLLLDYSRYITKSGVDVKEIDTYRVNS
jgi:hypothetical protein